MQGNQAGEQADFSGGKLLQRVVESAVGHQPHHDAEIQYAEDGRSVYGLRKREKKVEGKKEQSSADGLDGCDGKHGIALCQASCENGIETAGKNGTEHEKIAEQRVRCSFAGTAEPGGACHSDNWQAVCRA